MPLDMVPSISDILISSAEVAALVGDARPAWLWSADGRTVLWANRIGLDLLGFDDVAAARQRTLPNDTAAAHLARIAVSGSPAPTMARLRYYRGLRPVNLMAQCRATTLAGESRAVIGIGIEATAEGTDGERVRADIAALGTQLGPYLLIDSTTDTIVDASDAGFRAAVADARGNDATAFDAIEAATVDGERRAVRLLALFPPFRLVLAGDILTAEHVDDGTPDDGTPDDGIDDAVKDLSSEGEDDATKTAPEIAKTAVPATAINAGTGSTEAKPVAAFPFRRQSRPARFVWQMDAEMRFTDVSDELAAAVGPTARHLEGRLWAEVADELGLDPDGKIAGALERHDTWSGLTVLWPVAGTNIRVPVDLAALPAFGHKRSFSGYRGFGVCRTMDAAEHAPAKSEETAETESAENVAGAADTSPAGHADNDAVDIGSDSTPPDHIDDRVGDDSAETAANQTAEPDSVKEADSQADGADSQAGERETGAGEQPDTPAEAPTGEPTSPMDKDANEPTMAKIAEIIHDAGAESTDAEAEPDANAKDVDADETSPNADASDHDADAPATDKKKGLLRPRDLLPSNDGHRTRIDNQDLSRPEREAFRLIADLLGARLEGEDEQPAASADRADHDATPPETETETPGSFDGAFDDGKVVTLPSAFAAGKPQPIDPTLLDRLPIGVLIARDRDVLYVNQPMLDLTGYASGGELANVGGLDALFVDPEEWDPQAFDSDEAQADGDRKMPIRRRDGDKVTVCARLHAVPWNGGNALMMSFRPSREAPAATKTPPPVATLNAAPAAPARPAPESPDSGKMERERADALANDLAALRFRIEELETIIETATDGVLMLDGQGVILGVNRSAEALFGVERTAMIGETLVSLLIPESRRAARDYLDGLASNGVASVLNDGREVIAEVPGGGLVPLSMTIGRVGEASGDKFCAVLSDMTPLKRAEEDLTIARRRAEDASDEKSEILAKISHEVRTPLNAIIGFSEVMMEERFGPVGNERYREYLRDIHGAGDLILNLIDDLLDLTRIEAGKFELTFEAISPNEIVQECVALTQPRANRERVIIRTSLSSAVPKIVADGRSLRQIVLNLLSNAINFNISGGQVIVSTVLEDNGEVVLRVRDTGVGISDKDIDTALEPFRQLHSSRRGGGTGLGLPLTKALVEANRAALTIDSELGRGTLVQVAFPITRVLAD